MCVCVCICVFSIKEALFILLNVLVFTIFKFQLQLSYIINLLLIKLDFWISNNFPKMIFKISKINKESDIYVNFVSKIANPNLDIQFNPNQNRIIIFTIRKLDFWIFGSESIRYPFWTPLTAIVWFYQDLVAHFVQLNLFIKNTNCFF